MKYSILAPAKINLYLDVISRRDDGYHEIESVMQAISLCDEISLEISDFDGLKISLNGSDSSLNWDESNLAFKACKLFVDELGICNRHIDIFVQKNIPISAGMAGGSTDASATLILLNKAFGEPFSKEKLCALGARLGADVPFCIMGGTCLCEGIGDILTPTTSFKDKLLVCAIDCSSVSTPQAYALIDKKYGADSSKGSDINAFLKHIEKGDMHNVCTSLFNKFENVIIPEYPSISKIKGLLFENGAIGALMSGSGPSVFGIFENEADQKKAYDALSSSKIRAFLCKTL